MTVKLLLLKSGEDLIADVTEMVVGKEDDYTVIGYFLDRPCIVKMIDSGVLSDDEGVNKKAGFGVSLIPWMPLSKDERISIPADWLVTMVEPVTNLLDIYVKNIANYGKDNQSPSVNEQSDTNNAD